jgi:hypothetical protein
LTLNPGIFWCRGFPISFSMAYAYNADREEVFKRLGQGWHPVPNLLFAMLMVLENDKARRIPSSFWKYTFVLWHAIFFNRGSQKDDWTADFYMDQFHIDRDEASKWTIAYKNSRLFKIVRVRPRYPSKEPVSVFIYNRNCTSTDWKGFYLGLMAAHAEVRGQKWPGIDQWSVIVRRHIEAQTDALIEDEGGVRALELA